VASHLHADLSLVVEPPGDHAVDLAEEVHKGQLGQQDHALLVVAAADGAVLDLHMMVIGLFQTFEKSEPSFLKTGFRAYKKK
jgi:hypothetical protein